jgi:hypothetical protein
MFTRRSRLSGIRTGDPESDSRRCRVLPYPYPYPYPYPAYFALIDFTKVSCGACLLVFQPPGSAV